MVHDAANVSPCNPVFARSCFAAILQPPFFDPNADPAVNYGAIGGVIGHEMGHGFDDQGAKSDARGVLRDWWNAQDVERFGVVTGRLAAQYEQFSPLEGLNLNGRLTLGENIGDNGGLQWPITPTKSRCTARPRRGLTAIAAISASSSAGQVWRGKLRERSDAQSK